MKKILIVDDSLVYRHALNSALSECRDIQVVGAVKNGQEAIDFIAKNAVDLVTLDIEMPVMDGFAVLQRLSQFPSKPKVIVFTSLDSSGANNAIRALHLGAHDFLTKIEGTTDISNNISEVKDALLPKIYSLLHLDKTYTHQTLASVPQDIKKSQNRIRPLKRKYDYIFIGSSTGGPEALREIFDGLKGVNLIPILIVQHMPPLYTAMLAQGLEANSSYKVVEAKNGMLVEKGRCYVAPGDYHMEVVLKDNQLVIKLNQAEKECFVRPSVNYLFRSADSVASNSLFVVLTGMGNDGVAGIEKIIDKNPDVLIQDESTSVVWGMPGEIAARNLQNQESKIGEIKLIINKLIQ